MYIIVPHVCELVHIYTDAYIQSYTYFHECWANSYPPLFFLCFFPLLVCMCMCVYTDRVAMSFA